MSKINKFYFIKEESRNEIYVHINKNLRELPRKKDGSFNEFEDGFVNNDVDALRHAYVSGVYTMEFGDSVADFKTLLYGDEELLATDVKKSFVELRDHINSLEFKI